MLELMSVILAILCFGVGLVILTRFLSVGLRLIFDVGKFILTYLFMLAIIEQIIKIILDPILRNSFRGIILTDNQINTSSLLFSFLLIIIIFFSKSSSPFKIYGTLAVITNALLTTSLFSLIYEFVNPTLPNYKTASVSYATVNVISIVVYLYLIAVNTSTIIFYGYDKFRAWIFPKSQGSNNRPASLNNWSQRLARWFESFAPWIKPPRVPEWILHWHSICGGSLGAAIAQYFFNHKTSKQTFRVVYLKTVGIQITILVTLFFVNQYR